MKYYCDCKNEVNLKEDRVEGKYVYKCSRCGKESKKKELRSEVQIYRREIQHQEQLEVATHPCDSCDEIVEISTMDNYGRCEKCQRECPID